VKGEGQGCKREGKGKGTRGEGQGCKRGRARVQGREDASSCNSRSINVFYFIINILLFFVL
jgi:hypothetical protein